MATFQVFDAYGHGIDLTTGGPVSDEADFSFDPSDPVWIGGDRYRVDGPVSGLPEANRVSVLADVFATDNIVLRQMDFFQNTTPVVSITGLSLATSNVQFFSEEDLVAGDDVMIGNSFDDTIDGGMGNDTLTGNAGNDILRGEAGDDIINGGDGRDTLVGGDGDDTLTGGTSEADLRDALFGGNGNDLLDGGFGNDELRGDAGNDTLRGGFGVDELFGGDGDDVINGGAFSDLVFGGAGDDFVNGGFGSDRINGGAGADTFFHLGIPDHGSDWVQDFSHAEGDVLQFGGAGSAADFQVNVAATEGAGDAGVDEAFIVHIPSGLIVWALVDGMANDQILLQFAGSAETFDLLA